jgi:flagellar biogenesis protein FliO
MAQASGSRNDSQATSAGQADLEGQQVPPGIQTRESFIDSTQEPQNIGVDAWTYVRFFVALAVVLGVIWAFSLLMKKLLVARGLAGSAECLKLLYTQSLSPSKHIYLVRLVDRVLLIGSGEGGLTTLAEITDPSEVSAILKELEFKGNFDFNPFREKLKSLAGDEPKDSGDFNIRQDRMKGTLDRLRDIGGPQKKQ